MAGPFAAVSTGALIRDSDTGAGTRLGALTADQSYALGRAVLGDGAGAEVLRLVDQKLGAGKGAFVQRMLALGHHEGKLDFGKRNPDPASGYDIGAFQIGGRKSTQAQSQKKYDTMLEAGIERYKALGGTHLNRESLTVADRDVLAHIGYIESRNKMGVAKGTPNGLFGQLSDPNVSNLGHIVGRNLQGGIDAIGTDVVRLSSRTQGMRVDLAAVAARAAEPDATRRQPSMPVISRRSSAENYGKGEVYSPAVKQWQGILAAKGLPFGAKTPNGVYDIHTLNSTRTLQEKAGLSAKGTVGPQTWARYGKDQTRSEDYPAAAKGPASQKGASQQSAQPSPPAAGPLKEGATGASVKALQHQLAALGYEKAVGVIDGRFDAELTQVVRRFQKAHGLPADKQTGTVGAETRAAIAGAAQDRDARNAARRDAAPVAAPAASRSPAAPKTAGSPQPSPATGGDGSATAQPPTAAPATSAPANAAGVFLREADGALSNLLDRHTQDVPGTLAALIAATRGPGSGDLGRTTPDDVQRAFAEATAGRPALPLSRTEAGMIASVLDERSRLVAEGATPAPAAAPASPGGDGASRLASAPSAEPVSVPVR